jgi:hypothetical protein
MRIEKIEFEQLTKNVIDDKIETYFMFVRMYIDKQFDMQKMHVSRRIQIEFALAKIEKNFDIKITFFEIFRKYEKLNKKNKIYELSNHDSNDHAIDLKKNKKSSHESIYFLFENEFKILRVYIEKHLINDFIRFSQFSVETFILFVKKKR